MNYIGIIPARYASTRFPGKPLALLGGKPVIQHVWEQACKVLDTVLVATDDERIAACVRGFGGEVVMTSSECRNGTERIAEALHNLLSNKEKEHPEGDIGVINIQGDEPFVLPEQIEQLKSLFPTDIATLTVPIRDEETLFNPNCVKVVFNERKEAIYFSRNPIPFLRGIPESEWVAQRKHYKHIGLYAYRAEVLQRIVRLSPSPLEQAESLEQLRWLEAGYTIRVGVTTTETIGIDTPADLRTAEDHLRKV